jgi:asparaginyl-tRNA synthetase
VGWIKSFRDQKEIKFLHLNDGSDSRNIQLVIAMENFKKSSQNKNLTNLFGSIYFNTSVEVIGTLVQSTGQKQSLEILVNELNIISEHGELKNYPFQFKVNYSLEQMRHHISMRSHLSLFASIMRFRSQLTMSFHDYFYRNDYVQVHTPILTSNNCEGGCETFQVNVNEKDKGLVGLEASEENLAS